MIPHVSMITTLSRTRPAFSKRVLEFFTSKAKEQRNQPKLQRLTSLSMAASFLSLSTPNFRKLNLPSLSSKAPTGFKRSALSVNAIATKYEPAKVVPQADRVLIRVEALPEKSAGGVLLPKSAVKFERYLMGEVLSVGAEAGEVEAGKKVLFSDINAYEVDLGTEDRHCFCKAGDLLAVVE